MGGEVFVGVRRSSGEEVHGIRWTNNIPWYITDPTFMDEGAGLESFFEEQDPKERRSQVEYSEYGVILIDFKTKKLLSFQDYCEVPRVLVNYFDGRDTYSPAETAAHVLKMHESGRLRIKISPWSMTEQLTTTDPEKIIELLRDCDEGGCLRSKAFLNFEAWLDWSPWTIESGMSPKKADRSRVRAFLEENGWRTRVKGTKNVRP